MSGQPLAPPFPARKQHFPAETPASSAEHPQPPTDRTIALPPFSPHPMARPDRRPPAPSPARRRSASPCRPCRSRGGWINPHHPLHPALTTLDPRRPTLPGECPGLPNTVAQDVREPLGLECVIAVTSPAGSHTHVTVDANDTDAAATGRQKVRPPTARCTRTSRTPSRRARPSPWICRVPRPTG